VTVRRDDRAGVRPPPPGREVIYEHRRMGAWLRVAAVDAATGIEAVATGPAEAPAMVERLAAAKLERLLAARRR
jgi:hypothetical protein